MRVGPPRPPGRNVPLKEYPARERFTSYGNDQISVPFLAGASTMGDSLWGWRRAPARSRGPLDVFSVGGVIQRGEKIMNIVPLQDGLTIEAQRRSRRHRSDFNRNTRARFISPPCIKQQHRADHPRRRHPGVG